MMNRSSTGLILTTVVFLALFVQAAPAQDDPLRDSARKLLAEARWHESLIAYEKLLAKAPDDVELLVGAGRALFEQDENSRSRHYFVRAQRADGKCWAAIHYQARILERVALARTAQGISATGSLADAAILYREAADVAVDGAYDDHMRAAACYITLEQNDDALAQVQEALKARPLDAAAMHLRSRLAFALGHHEDVRVTTADYLDRHGTDASVQAWRLEALARLGRVEETEGLFLELVGADVGIWPYAVLRRSWTDDDRRDDWRRAVEKAQRLQPESAVPDFYFGVMAWLDGDLDGAVKAYQRYVDRAPGDASGFLEMSRLHMARADTAEASSWVREALAMAPGRTDIRDHARRVVAAWVAAKDFKRALDLQNAIVVVAPDDPAVIRGHAILLKEVGRLEESNDELRRLIGALDPGDQRMGGYMNDLALGLKGAGRTKEAEALLRRTIEEHPFTLDAIENLGVLLLERGEDGEAAQRFAEVLEMEPERLRSRYYARCLQRAAP